MKTDALCQVVRLLDVILDQKEVMLSVGLHGIPS